MSDPTLTAIAQTATAQSVALTLTAQAQTATALAQPTATSTPTPTVTPTPTPTATATPTPAPTAIVRPTNTPPPTPTVPGVVATDLIVNGGFENDTTPWQMMSAGNYSLISPIKPHTGKFGAFLCGGDNCSDQLWQTVTLPASFSNITFSYWLWIETQDPATVCNDFFTAQFRNGAGTTSLDTVTSKCNTDATNSWVQQTVDVTADLRPFAGQQVQVYFSGTTDATGSTSFFVDDVSLKAQVLVPTATPTPTITPTPAPTNTPTSTPTPTPTPVPVVHVMAADLLKSTKGEIVDTCDAVLSNNVPLQPTSLLFPNQTGILRIFYQANNTATNSPVGQVVYQEKGKVVDGDVLVPGNGPQGPFMCAAVSFSGKGVHHYDAKVTVALGPAAGLADVFFTVGKCANGKTGSRGQCLKCNKGYHRHNGKCVKTQPPKKKKKRYEDVWSDGTPPWSLIHRQEGTL